MDHKQKEHQDTLNRLTRRLYQARVACRTGTEKTKPIDRQIEQTAGMQEQTILL